MHKRNYCLVLISNFPYLTGRLQDGKTNVRVSLVNDETKQLMDYLQARSVKSSPKAISATKTSVYDSPYRSMRYGMNNVLEGLSSCEHHCRESYGHTQQGMDIQKIKNHMRLILKIQWNFNFFGDSKKCSSFKCGD